MSRRSQNARKHGAHAEIPKSLVLFHLTDILSFMPDAGDLIYPSPKLANRYLSEVWCNRNRALEEYMKI